MQQSHIIINDLKFYGYHGVYPEEAVIGTSFSVDVDIQLNPKLLCFETDSLDDALDYESVICSIMSIGTKRRFKLIERLALVIADNILNQRAVAGVTVTVRKLVKFATTEPQWVAVQVTKMK